MLAEVGIQGVDRKYTAVRQSNCSSMYWCLIAVQSMFLICHIRFEVIPLTVSYDLREQGVDHQIP